MMIFLYKTGVFLARVLPFKTGYMLANASAYIFYLVARKDKKEMKANLKVIFGDDLGDKEADRLTLSIFKNFAKYLADFFRYFSFDTEYLNKRVEVEGLENLDNCLSKGKGIILVSLHIGNWELGAAVVGKLKYPISAIVLEHKDKKVNEFFIKQRDMNGFKSIRLGAQVKECFKVLRNNEVLAVMGDKDYTATGIPVDFFGKKALMPKGPAALALKTGSPIIIAKSVRQPDDTFKVTFSEPIKYEATGDVEQDVLSIMRLYLDEFESIIKANPDQWYAFRKIWKPEQITQ